MEDWAIPTFRPASVTLRSLSSASSATRRFTLMDAKSIRSILLNRDNPFYTFLEIGEARGRLEDGLGEGAIIADTSDGSGEGFAA